jgi:hypothetical protein
MPGREVGSSGEPTECQAVAGARALMPSTRAPVARPAREPLVVMFHVERHARRGRAEVGVPETGIARRERSRWGKPTMACGQAAARIGGRLGQPAAAGGSTWNTGTSDGTATARTGASIGRGDLGAGHWFDRAYRPAAETSRR